MEKHCPVLGISRWTVSRQVQSYGLQNMQQFSVLSDAQIDEIIVEYLSRHGLTTGRTYLAGYLRSRGLRVQRRGFAKVSLGWTPKILLCDEELLLLEDSILYPGQIPYGIWMATMHRYLIYTRYLYIKSEAKSLSGIPS